jgi:hypothetical protein
VEYLGHVISLGGFGVQKAKVEAILQVFKLVDISWLRTFLGLCNYYQRFVKGFSNIIKLLTRLTHIDQ